MLGVHYPVGINELNDLAVPNFHSLGEDRPTSVLSAKNRNLPISVCIRLNFYSEINTKKIY